MTEIPVILRLHRDEAIALIHLLLRYRDHDRLTIECPADTHILYDLCALLEQQLGPELLAADWGDRVRAAQARVVDGDHC